MPHAPTTWVPTVTELKAEYFNNIEASLVIARALKGVAPGTYTLATITVNAEGFVSFAADGTPGAVANSSTTVKGASKSSTAPTDALNPVHIESSDPKVGAATPTQRALLKASSTNADPVALLISDPTVENYISGLKLSWNSATSITISSGSAFIPGLGTIYNAPSAITKSSLATTANTWYYLYLYNNGGSPDVEVSVTAPASPYKGTARTKTSDTTRRFLRAIRCGTSNNTILNDTHRGDWIFYREHLGASPLQVLPAGTSVTEVNVACNAVVPLTSQLAEIQYEHNNGHYAHIGHSEDNITLSNTAYLQRLGWATPFMVSTPTDLDSSQQFSYKWETGFSAPSGANGLIAGVRGYLNER